MGMGTQVCQKMGTRMGRVYVTMGMGMATISCVPKFPSADSMRMQYNTRNSSGDEIANVNFLYDDIVHVLQNTIDSCINSATDRRGGYVLEPMFTIFS